MNRPLLIATACIFLVTCLCDANENPSLNYTCTETTLLLLMDFGEFIMVPTCKVNKDAVKNTYIVSNCSKDFRNGEYIGYLFHQSDNISQFRTFTVNCNDSSSGIASLSNFTNINITKVFPTFDFTLTVGKGNTSYDLGQEIPVILEAAGPYMITPAQCIAESSEHPEVNIILWQNGTTQQQYLLTNFSARCNSTLTAKMYGFRFLNSHGIRLTCAAQPCSSYLEDEPMDANDGKFLYQKGYSEDDDLGQIPELSVTHTIIIRIQ